MRAWLETVLMEAAVRWSPFSTEDRQRFLLVDVTDQSLTLNQISHRNYSHASSFQVARYGRLPNFGAFDWSKTDEVRISDLVDTFTTHVSTANDLTVHCSSRIGLWQRVSGEAQRGCPPLRAGGNVQVTAAEKV